MSADDYRVFGRVHVRGDHGRADVLGGEMVTAALGLLASLFLGCMFAVLLRRTAEKSAR